MTPDKRSNRIETVIIERRYNGPETSGNGGWVAGSLARRFGAASVSVTLRAPVPLAVPLHARNAARAEDARHALPRAEAIIEGDLDTVEGAKMVAERVNELSRCDAVIHNAARGQLVTREVDLCMARQLRQHMQCSSPNRPWRLAKV
jgi:hypothetical protein